MGLNREPGDLSSTCATCSWKVKLSSTLWSERFGAWTWRRHFPRWLPRVQVSAAPAAATVKLTARPRHRAACTRGPPPAGSHLTVSFRVQPASQRSRGGDRGFTAPLSVPRGRSGHPHGPATANDTLRSGPAPWRGAAPRGFRESVVGAWLVGGSASDTGVLKTPRP